MSKKIVLAIFGVFVILVAGGGFFWWWQGREIKGSPEDYVIVDRPEGMFIENKKAGLSVKVPEGWEVEKAVEDREGLMVFYSPGVEGALQDHRIVPPLDKGCIIHVSLVYEAKDINQLRVGARYNLSFLGVKSLEFEDTTVNDFPVLRTIADTERIGPGIGVDIPHKDRTYSFLLIYASEEQEFCVQEFNKFLETILIE